MSDHPVAVVDGDEMEGVAGLWSLLRANLRMPDALVPGQGTITYRYTPDLTAAEATTFDRLVSLARQRSVTITPAEWNTIQPDVATVRQYVGLASPTAAQTAAALKSLIRVVGALLRQ
jgi:hypothetical protein